MHAMRTQPTLETPTKGSPGRLSSETYPPRVMLPVLRAGDLTALFLLNVFWVPNVTPLAAGGSARGDLRVFAHTIAPAVGTLLLLLPLASYILPPIPGVGTFFTTLGFAPTPFSSNILPLFVLAWVVLGLVYATILAKCAPEGYECLGRIVRGDGREPGSEREA